jgi:hypothetical protein
MLGARTRATGAPSRGVVRGFAAALQTSPHAGPGRTNALRFYSNISYAECTISISAASHARVYAMTPDRGAAIAVRAAWMRLMGYSEDEVTELCSPDVGPEPLLEEELENLKAARRMAASSPTDGDIQSWARASTSCRAQGESR